MKRIEVAGPIVLNLRAKGGVERFEFAPGRAYEVKDAVAAHPYLAKYLLKVIDVEGARKTRAKKESQDDGSRSVQGSVPGT